jgi:protocatechuate 3,4-dioxygenase beta subunit
MDRKKFLRTSSIAIVGLPLATIVSCKSVGGNGDHINCRTGEDILGPFYRAEAPFRNALNVMSEEGTPIIIKGKVMGGQACGTALSGAIVDVWQADDAGEYDNESSEYKFRGRLETDKNGNYEFMSILPGRYLNGGQLRPRHIHFMVKADNHLDLVTQLYFEADEYIESDPWASEAEDGRIVKLETADDILTGTFDINLKLR